MIIDAKGKVEVFDELCSTVVHGITPNLIEDKGVFTDTSFYKTLQSLNNQENYLRYAFELYKDEQAEANKYNITIKAHDAIGDVNPMLKMEELTTTPIFIETFAFGKHKGQKISDVCNSDIGYINWMQKNMDLDVDIKYTLDKIMGGM